MRSLHPGEFLPRSSGSASRHSDAGAGSFAYGGGAGASGYGGFGETDGVDSYGAGGGDSHGHAEDSPFSFHTGGGGLGWHATHGCSSYNQPEPTVELDFSSGGGNTTVQLEPTVELEDTGSVRQDSTIQLEYSAPSLSRGRQRRVHFQSHSSQGEDRPPRYPRVIELSSDDEDEVQSHRRDRSMMDRSRHYYEGGSSSHPRDHTPAERAADYIFGVLPHEVVSRSSGSRPRRSWAGTSASATAVRRSRSTVHRTQSSSGSQAF